MYVYIVTCCQLSVHYSIGETTGSLKIKFLRAEFFSAEHDPAGSRLKWNRFVQETHNSRLLVLTTFEYSDFPLKSP